MREITLIDALREAFAEEMGEIQRLLPSDGSAYTWFGSAVDLSGAGAQTGPYR